MDWEKHRATEETWRTQTAEYVAALNAFVKMGEEEGWDAAGAQPEDPRTEALGRAVVDVVREANESGEWRELRGRYPTAHAPLIPLLEAKATGIRQCAFVDDVRVIAHTGGPGETLVCVFGIDGESEVLDARAAGVSWDRKHVALVKDERVEVREGLDGAVVATMALPRGDEDLPEAYAGLDESELALGAIVGVRPFRKGKAVLLVTGSGVWVCRERGVKRLFPDRAWLAERAEEWEDDDAWFPSLAMVHGEVSPDGKLVAAGAQDSQHVVMKRDGEVVARFGPIGSEYPHHAGFSPDDKWAFFNSCHFYNGVSVKVRRRHLEGLYADGYDDHEHAELLSGGPRVYSSAWHDGAFLLGTSNGYVVGIDAETSEMRFRHFVGSTVNGVDVSPDGSTMAIATYAGFLSLVALNADEPDPYVIGTGSNRELLRYVKWRGEKLWRW